MFYKLVAFLILLFAAPAWGAVEIERVVVGGFARAWKYYDSASNVVRIDIFNDSAVTDYGAAATVGSIAWAISTLTASGEIHLSQGTYNLDTGLSLDGKTGISIIGSAIKYHASKLSTNDAIVMLSMDKSRYCKISNLIFDGTDNATKGIYCYASDTSGGTNYENIFDDLMIEDCTRGIEMGTTDNYQASENTLRNVIFSSNQTGLYLRGMNTLNITLYSCKFDSNATAIDSSGGNFIAYSPLFVLSTTRDILLGAAQRQTVIIGGQTEQGEKALEIGSNGTNFGYTFIGFSFIADASTADATFIQDSSLFPASFIDCRFTYGAGATFGGYTPVPETETATYKIFQNCVWKNNDSATTAPVIAGAQTNQTVMHLPGLTQTLTVKGSDGNNCNLTLTGGLITAETCP